MGIAQIHKICVDDINRILGKKIYKYSDRLCPKKSKEMYYIYTNYYCGIDASFEERVRVWNGGATGMKNKKTLLHWRKVNNAYKEYTSIH